MPFMPLQEVKLQEAVLPTSPEMALSLYQYATLQYTRGLLEHGEELCSASLDLCRQLHKKERSSHVRVLIYFPCTRNSWTPGLHSTSRKNPLSGRVPALLLTAWPVAYHTW